MTKQVLVVGMGQFGTSLVRALSELDIEVIAVDKREEKLEPLARIAASVAVMDATNELELAGLRPEKRDVCICAIGDESREASIICTALLRQLGAPRVIARATDAVHERILTLIGAHEVINPESDVGRRMAVRVAHSDVLGEFPLGEGLVLSELEAPEAFVGHSLTRLALPARHQIMVVAIRQDDAVTLPRAETVVRPRDVLVVVAKPGAVNAMLDAVA